MTITEVSRKYGLTQDTLRYYERAGLIPCVNRNLSGVRNYSEADCRWVEFAKCMRSAGLAVDVLAKYRALAEQGEETAEARRSLLIEQRAGLTARMEEMRETLARLDSKIDKLYQETTTEKELKEA